MCIRDRDDINLIGKTGTGQVAQTGGYKQNFYTNSFAGLAPYDDPQVVIVLWLSLIHI